MKAATLMNSGTVTKKPAMKLRRSHCIYVRLHPAAIAANSSRPSAMRYHANGANPERVTNGQKRLHHDQGRDEGHDQADADLDAAVGRHASPAPRSRSCANAAAIVGMARKKENSAAARRSRPMAGRPESSRPTATRRARARASGTGRCRTARASGTWSMSRTVGAGRYARPPA